MDEKMKTKSDLNKKAQVTIFIILALLLVVVIAILFVLIKQPQISNPLDEKDPQQYMDLCVKDAVKEAVDIMMPQGGYLVPNNSKLYGGKEIAYLCYNREDYLPCVNQEPLLIEHLEQEITDYINPRVENCFQGLKASLEKKNNQVSMGNSELKSRLTIKQINIDITKEMSIINGNDEQKFSNFNIKITSPLYDLAKITNEIVNQESLYCEFDYVSYMMLYPEYKIERYLSGSAEEGYDKDSTRIYTITEKSSGKSFRFAIKGCTIPPGYKPR
ncbi:MAG: hypothetical protein WC438_00845 [Candidatus Pacearchaeota archaeon]